MVTRPSALIIDDNFHNRNILRIGLETAGFDVFEASQGLEGIALLEQNHYQIMLLDIQMPEMDGISLLKRLSPTHRPKHIIVITAHAHMTNDIVDNNADLVMVKPISINALTTLLQRLQQ